jgi:hypothetical protein
MRRDLERRLRHLEIADAGSDAVEVWIGDGDGTLCGPRGERMTREAFDLLYPRGRHGVIIIDGDDARI